MDNPFQSPRVLSFCTGLKGIERGLTKVLGSIREVCCVENEACVITNLVAEMEEGVVGPCPVWTDVKTFPAKIFRKKIEIITGGYPCTPFSLAGRRLGEYDPRHLWPYIEKHVDTIRPVAAFFENVDDHLTLGFPTVYRSLRNMGYAVEAGVYSAEEVGSPQQRDRIFILAVEHTSLKQLRNLWKYHPEKLAFLSRPGEEKLANANRILSGGRFTGLPGTTEEIKRKAWQQWSRDQPEHSGETMADSASQGLAERGGESAWPQRKTIERSSADEKLADTDSSGSRQDSEPGELWPDWLIKSPGYSWDAREDFYGWPAGAGTFQFPWEEPRTIKSSMGCTTNGYNFREDILRMLGNMVVSQCVEIAFPELLLKLLS